MLYKKMVKTEPGTILEVSSDAEMQALLTSDNVNKCYKFTGTAGTYTNGYYYVVSSGLGFDEWRPDELIGTGNYAFRELDIIVKTLCFTANTAGSTITMSGSGTFYTSADGINWTDFIPGTTTITLTNAGDFVYFKGNNPSGFSSTCKFTMTGSIAASGNIMGLLDNGACSTLTIPKDSCFNYMFQDCSSLTTPPELPATTLTKNCYHTMFKNCTNLTKGPVLPAAEVSTNAYYTMFQGCTSLVKAPVIQASTIGQYGCLGMFIGCTALTTAPSLPATNLKGFCYAAMFDGCTSLTTPPALPATNVSSSCYSGYDVKHIGTMGTMFMYCSSLIVSDTSGSGYDKEWRIPAEGTWISGTTYKDLWYQCATGAGRSSNHLVGTAGSYVTYYTQNTPV